MDFCLLNLGWSVCVVSFDPLESFQETQGAGQFCSGLPKCVIKGSPKINYVAAYQFDGEKLDGKRFSFFLKATMVTNQFVTHKKCFEY